VDLLAGVFEIFLVIGHEEEFAAGLECFADGIEKGDLDKTATVMSHLGPRIGTEKMNAGYGFLRQQPFHNVFRIEPQYPGVFELHSRDLAAHFLTASEQTLNADEVPFRKLLREINEKRAVTASEIDFQRPIAMCDFVFLQTSEEVRRDEFVRRKRRAGKGVHLRRCSAMRMEMKRWISHAVLTMGVAG